MKKAGVIFWLAACIALVVCCPLFAAQGKETTFNSLLEKGFVFPSDQPQATAADIAAIETMAGAPLPEQHKDYLLHANGGGIVDPHLPKALSGYGTRVTWPRATGFCLMKCT